MEVKTQFKETVIEKHQKRTRMFFVRLICVAFLTVLFLSYFALPISKVKSGKIEGIYYLSREDILETIGVKESSFIFNINKNRADEYLSNHPLIEDASISCSYFHLNIDIKEYSPAVKDYENNVYLKDGRLLDLNNFKNSITNEMIDNLPYIVSSNDSYVEGSFKKTRDILYELALIFVAIFNEDIDYVDFKKINSTDFFAIYLKLDEKYNNIFNGEEGYIEFLFDASRISSYYDNNTLKNVVEKFCMKQSTLFDNFDSSKYVNNDVMFDKPYKTKTIYVYPKTLENKTIELTFLGQVESEV